MNAEANLTGTYILLLHLPADTTIEVGRLGTVDFPAGWYTYVGSAFGAGGLVSRIKHHLQPPDNLHWHIDYLRQAAEVREVWLSPDTERREQAWVDLMLEIPGATALVEGFGASDSIHETHLLYFDLKPFLEDFAIGVRRRFPEAKIIRAYTAAE